MRVAGVVQRAHWRIKMQVYVVMGTSGEYSDRYEWGVCVYQDEALAQQHVIMAQKEASIINKAISDLDWSDFIEFDNNESKQNTLIKSNIFDVNMQSDTYTGTSYYICAVDMLTALPTKD